MTTIGTIAENLSFKTVTFCLDPYHHIFAGLSLLVTGTENN